MNQDTICAIATAQGGAIGCIRVSGPEAIEITSCIFTPAATNRELGDSKPYTLTFGRIYDGSEVIDEVLVSLFRAPHSYTGVRKSLATVLPIFFRKYYNYSSRMVVAWLPQANIPSVHF